ncbi:uncharacterized protein DUF3261 [Acidovorax sp. 69]|uniref:DUF3261 domain-containing protein n=1 Tax=Acidovorax sp. 69 TaxID=2035202 RepID=UPI000C246AE5|nr:DUF3261 domain-containing protein [Acidovorax sp. 69]PJI98642.1 uncharacterized protein DUF3261 [Acidovorax sp. 69]
MSVAPIVFRSRLGAALLTVLLLSACASPGAQNAARVPLLALSPAALGCSVAVQQRLTVELPDRPAQQLEALLEVDAEAVRLAFFLMGQGMGTMVWDGNRWDKQLGRQWPAQLAPEQVLSDLQLAFWPASTVQDAFKAPWSVEASATGRRLLRNGQERVRVQFVGSSAVEITYPQGPFTLRVESPGGARLCASAQGAS